jgi:uncharacterized protein YqeY
MSLKAQIEADLKQAMLSGDKQKALTLRGVKSTILYAEVAEGKRDEGLPEDALTALLAKEAKKRQESIDLYEQGGNQERADAERQEQAIIEAYLPEKITPEALRSVVEEVTGSFDNPSPRDMGSIIAQVKQKVGPSADGAVIAAMVKEHITS